MDYHDVFHLRPSLPLFLTIELPTDGQVTPPSHPNCLGIAILTGDLYSDDSGESTLEDIVDLTLPTPIPKTKNLIIEFFKPTKRQLVVSRYPRTGASTTGKNSAILFPIIQSHSN